MAIAEEARTGYADPAVEEDAAKWAEKVADAWLERPTGPEGARRRSRTLDVLVRGEPRHRAIKDRAMALDALDCGESDIALVYAVLALEARLDVLDQTIADHAAGSQSRNEAMEPSPSRNGNECADGPP